MLTETNYAAIRHWVTYRLGCSFEDIDGVALREHGGSFVGYHGVYVWRMGQKTLVSVPKGSLRGIRGAVARQRDGGQPVSALTDEAFWRAALGERVERVIGPAYQGFLNSDNFQPADAQGARPLTPTDQPALRAFIAACPPDDWEDSAITPQHLPIIGLERDGELVAVASSPREQPATARIFSVGVVTLPAWRGKGAGLAVVAALAQHRLERGAQLRYQTLRSNLPSLAIARRLGFEDGATSLAVRLKSGGL